MTSFPDVFYASTFSGYAIQFKLSQMLNDKARLVTVFAPTNAAFEKLKKTDDGKTLFDGKHNIELKKVIERHIATEKVVVSNSIQDSKPLKSISGDIYLQKFQNVMYIRTQLVKARLTQTNIPGDNGYLNTIPDVLFTAADLSVVGGASCVTTSLVLIFTSLGLVWWKTF